MAVTPTVRPTRPAPAAAGLPHTGGSSSVSSGLWVLLAGGIVFVVAVSGVLAVSVPALAPATHRAPASGRSWSAQDVTGEPRGRRSQARTSAGTGWMVVVAATAALMALIGYVLVSTDRDR